MIELYVIEDYKDLRSELSGSALTDALIRDCLAEHGVFDVQIKRTGKGKPYMAFMEKAGETRKNLPPFHISVSHSGNYFACLIADRPAGIDIQHARSANMERISRRYFTSKESSYVDAHGERGFFILWTRKEAYSKYTGTGIEEIIKGTEVLDREDVEFFDFMLEEGMYCSCCIEKGQKDEIPVSCGE